MTSNNNDAGLEYLIGPKYGRPGDKRRLSELLLTFESTVEKSIKWVHKEDILCNVDSLIAIVYRFTINPFMVFNILHLPCKIIKS
jgi:hypothetical protein